MQLTERIIPGDMLGMLFMDIRERKIAYLNHLPLGRKLLRTGMSLFPNPCLLLLPFIRSAFRASVFLIPSFSCLI